MGWKNRNTAEMEKANKCRFVKTVIKIWIYMVRGEGGEN